MKKLLSLICLLALMTVSFSACDFNLFGEEKEKLPEIGTPIQITYALSDATMGTIEGELTQTVLYGQTVSTPVTVATDLYAVKFVGWSDGKTEPTREGDCPTKDTTYTAIFQPDVLDVPVLYITTDSGKPITSKTEYQTGKISVFGAGSEDNISDVELKIRGRGNYTWGSTFYEPAELWAKRPYRLKFDKKINLLGLGDGEAKNWVLLANHCDQSLIRNYISYSFAEALDGIEWQPNVKNVEVFLNGEYVGVYLLTEQVQVNEYRININPSLTEEKTDFLVMMSGYATEEGNDWFEVSGCTQPFEIKSDLSSDAIIKQRQIEYIQTFVTRAYQTLKNGDEKSVRQLIDVDSLIDVYLCQELFKQLDSHWDNNYMYATVDGKLTFGPIWDFDQCAGNADTGVEDEEGIRARDANCWFRQALKRDWFQALVRDRWEEIYDDIILNIPEQIRAVGKQYYNSFCRNFEKWKIFGLKRNRETAPILALKTYTEHYEYFATWMETRIEWLDDYIYLNFPD